MPSRGGSMDTLTTGRSRSPAISRERARSSNQMPESVSSPSSMDPQIVEPAQGRPPKLLEILQAVGIQTCRDVKMVWTSGSSLVEEYEVAHGRLTATIHAFWTMVSGRSHQEVQRATDAVIQDRASTVLIHAAPDPGEPVQADDHSGGLAFTTHLVSGADCRPPCPGEGDQGAEGGRLVLEDVLDLEALGLDTEQIQGPAVVQQLKETVMAQPSQLSATRLGALASSFRRWRRYALAHQCSIRKPTPLQLAAFLKEASRGGPTAAAALWQSLRWFEDKMGLPLGLQHFLVKPFQFLPAEHTAAQAPELQPWEFVNLVLWAASQRGTNLIVLAFIIMTAVSCVRFEHIQRSTWTAHHKDWTEFWCKQGTKRIKGPSWLRMVHARSFLTRVLALQGDQGVPGT